MSQAMNLRLAGQEEPETLRDTLGRLVEDYRENLRQVVTQWLSLYATVGTREVALEECPFLDRRDIPETAAWLRRQGLTVRSPRRWSTNVHVVELAARDED